MVVVVIHPPSFGYESDLFQIFKPISIKDVFPKYSVESPDVSMLCRLTWLDFNLIFFCLHHSPRLFDINSEPLSTRMKSGTYSSSSTSKARMTRWAGKLNASLMKSILHVWLALTGTCNGSLKRLG